MRYLHWTKIEDDDLTKAIDAAMEVCCDEVIEVNDARDEEESWRTREAAQKALDKRQQKALKKLQKAINKRLLPQ